MELAVESSTPILGYQEGFWILFWGLELLVKWLSRRFYF